MKTAIYLRKSRAEELSDGVGDTLKRHKDTLLAFANQQGLSIVKIYEEVISGENLYVRTEMLKLLSDIETGCYDAVLCMDIDRLGRGTMSQQGVILETFKSTSTKIITPRKVYDLNNDLDEEYTEFQTFFARRELKTINRRMRQGIDKTIQDGGYIPNAPYGYRKCKKGKLPTLEIVENEAAYVRIIFDMYVNQHKGCQTIATTINGMGAVPRRGTAFNRTTIMAIIKNDVYIGKVHWNTQRHMRPKMPGEKFKITTNDKDKWVIVDGVHPPIIELGMFEEAQKIAESKYHPPYNTGVLQNPLAGLMICSHCGGKMQCSRAGGTPYLLCIVKSCIKSTPFCYIEPAVISSIQNQLDRLKVNAKRAKPANLKSYIEALSQLRKEIAQAEGQRERLHDLLEQGVYSIDTFIERSKALDDKLNALHDSMAALNLQIEAASRRDINVVIQRIEDVLEAYDSADSASRNAMLKRIVKQIVYFKEPHWKADKFIVMVELLDVEPEDLQ